MKRCQMVLRYVYAPVFFVGFLALALWLLPVTEQPAVLGGLLLAAIGVSFAVERILPYMPVFNASHQDRLRDVLHALVNEISNSLSVLAYPLIVWLLPHGTLWPDQWPLWVQLALAIFVADFGISITHYLSHELPLLWRFHAVHHSVQRLYGLNGLMKHPLHQAIELTAAALPLLLLGMPQQIAWLLAFAVAIQLLLQHANVDMRIGPLIYLWAVAPAHRFHHAYSVGEQDANFGLFTSIWDHLLGTFRHHPARHFRVGEFGIASRPDYPKSYLGQLIEPFRQQG